MRGIWMNSDLDVKVKEALEGTIKITDIGVAYRSEKANDLCELTLLPFGRNVLLRKIDSMQARSSGGITLTHKSDDAYELLAEVLDVGGEVTYVKKGMIIRTDKRRTIQFNLTEELFLVEDRLILGQMVKVSDLENSRQAYISAIKEEIKK